MTFGVSGTQLKVIRTCSGAMCSLELMPQPSHPHFAPMNECRFRDPATVDHALIYLQPILYTTIRLTLQ